MSASRKLYTAMADKFKDLRPATGGEGYNEWVAMVIGTATVFANDNSGFDIRKFTRASGFSEEQVTASLQYV